MSLINDVLKDLDNRHSNDQPLRRANGRRPPPLQPVEPSGPKVTAIATGAVLGGVILVMLGFWSGLFESTEANVPAPDSTGIPVADITTKKALAAAAPAPRGIATEAIADSAKVLAVMVTKVARGEQLELLLSRAVAHRMQERSDTRLVISLPATRLQAHLPDVASSRLIDAIDIQQNDTDLLMQLSLASNGGVQTYLLSEANNVRLVVELFSTKSQPLANSPGTPAGQPVGEQPVVNQAEVVVAKPQSVFSKTAKQLSPKELDRQASDAALELARRGQARAAIRDLKEFTASAQSHRKASSTLATLLLSSGKLQEAQQVLVFARTSYAQDRTLQKLHARILLEQGSYPQALAVLDETGMETMDAEHLALRASLQQRTGAHDDAVGSYDRLLVQHGEKASWLVGRAISQEALGQGENARATYRQALRISEIDATLKNYASDRLKALN